MGISLVQRNSNEYGASEYDPGTSIGRRPKYARSHGEREIYSLQSVCFINCDINTYTPLLSQHNNIQRRNHPASHNIISSRLLLFYMFFL